MLKLKLILVVVRPGFDRQPSAHHWWNMFNHWPGRCFHQFQVWCNRIPSHDFTCFLEHFYSTFAFSCVSTLFLPLHHWFGFAYTCVRFLTVLSLLLLCWVDDVDVSCVRIPGKMKANKKQANEEWSEIIIKWIFMNTRRLQDDYYAAAQTHCRSTKDHQRQNINGLEREMSALWWNMETYVPWYVQNIKSVVNSNESQESDCDALDPSSMCVARLVMIISMIL